MLDIYKNIDTMLHGPMNVKIREINDVKSKEISK